MNNFINWCNIIGVVDLLIRHLNTSAPTNCDTQILRYST